MIPTTLHFETYKGADHDLIFEVKDGNGDPYEFTGTNTLQIFKKFAETPFLTIDLTWNGTQYTGAITSAESDIDAVKYPFEWKVDNGGSISYPAKGDMAHSDVYTSNRVTVGTTLTVSTVTNLVTVSDSFTAAGMAEDAASLSTEQAILSAAARNEAQEAVIEAQAIVDSFDPTIVGDGMWEPDGLTNIKPKESKKVDTTNIVGEVSGGIFQP